jgi:tRNA (adenine57-N1/adenine58-N1)-methyltransferase catalytic subunit
MRKREQTSDFLVPPHYRRLKRGPQVILPKDIGMIIAYTGISRNSVCVDAGAGSGWLAVSLAKLAKQVTSYETRDDFLEIARKNMEMENLDNLILKKGDVFKKITERNVDVVTLDLPDADKAIKNARAALKEDGYIVGYLPHMEQVVKFMETLNRFGFKNPITLEVIVRDLLVREQGMRPSTKGVWHTAYLVFAQK